jgi:cell division transport system ATP-binding protein
MLEFRGVSKVYVRAAGGRVQALVDASFRVASGEMVIVSGPAAAGKSTLCRLAWGEERPSRGSILLADEPLESAGGRGLARLRRRVGVVPQEPRLVPDRTVLGNVTVVLRALGMGRAAARARAVETLGAAGLGARLNALPGELAHGERGQLALARAMAPAPDLLVADEPWLGGDGAPVCELIRACHAQGTAVLVATRDARPIAGAGVRVLALEAGRLSGDGGKAAGGA